jgi:hypothetical protein
MANIIVSKLDAAQVARLSFDEAKAAVRVIGVGGTLVPDIYDDMVLTYIVSGNGTGEIGTVTYSLLGDAVAVLTLTYDGSNRLIQVTRT